MNYWAAFFGALFGLAVHMALTQAGITRRRPSYYVVIGSLLAGFCVVGTLLDARGYRPELGLLISGLVALGIVLIGFTWHLLYNRMR